MSPPTGSIRAATASVLLLVTLTLSWWGGLDAAAAERTHAALQRSLVTFALTRTLNGIISVAQGTELAFQPAGVGVVISAGEILDPLNDLVEQFSWLTLLAATSLGVQIMLGELFATVVVNVALSIAIGISIVLLWWQPARFPLARPGWLRLTATFVFLRFAIAIATLGTALISQHFLSPREDVSMAFLQQTSENVESASKASEDSNTAPDSVLQRLNKFIDDQRRALDIEQRLAQLRVAVETAIEHIINLIVVYIIETLLLPLGFLVVAWGLVKMAWRRIT